MPPIPTYWWQGVPNLGDQLTPLLLRRFAQIHATPAPSVREASLVVVGSVLEHIPPFWEGHIAGAGRMFEHGQINQISGRWKVHALRGPLSAKGVPGDYAIGDPGLLADHLVTVDTKRHNLGVVPHWSDGALAADPRFTQYQPKIIDVRGEPLDVIRQIGECRKIVTSSLHGLIIADAFGIPRRFEPTPRFDKEGGLFKFRDYSASVGAPFEPGKLTEANQFRVRDRQHELYDMFKNLGKVLAE